MAINRTITDIERDLEKKIWRLEEAIIEMSTPFWKEKLAEIEGEKKSLETAMKFLANKQCPFPDVQHIGMTYFNPKNNCGSCPVKTKKMCPGSKGIKGVTFWCASWLLTEAEKGGKE